MRVGVVSVECWWLLSPLALVESCRSEVLGWLDVVVLELSGRGTEEGGRE